MLSVSLAAQETREIPVLKGEVRSNTGEPVADFLVERMELLGRSLGTRGSEGFDECKAARLYAARGDKAAAAVQLEEYRPHTGETERDGVQRWLAELRPRQPR